MTDEAQLYLRRSAEDPAEDDPRYQEELNEFCGSLEAAAVTFSRFFISLNSANGGGCQLGEFTITLAHDVMPVVGAALVAWLHGRYGRKVRTRGW